MSPESPSIELEKVSLDFHGRRVLENISLAVREGEFIAILGSSGGGKSTLLRLIAGLLHGSGKLSVRGSSAMVFQDYRLLPWRTVRQNVALPAELGRGGMKPDEALALVGMKNFAALYPHQLSGGMRARVAIARALAQDANILLMDEPFAALDALVRERFNLELKKIHEKTGKTILFVTHSIREAVYLADRVVVLKNGRLELVLPTKGEGRITAFTEPLEAHLRDVLGVVDSTYVEPPSTTLRFPWEVLGIIAMALVLLVVWNLAVPTPTSFLPTPGLVWRTMLEKFDSLLPAAHETLRITGLGLLWSLFLGVGAGYLMGKQKILERLLSPFIVALQAIPVIIIAPILVLITGYSDTSRVLIATLISLFPILTATMIGVREVDLTYREVFATLRSGFWGLLSKLEFPGALPVILGGLRNTASLALIGTVVAEFTFPASSNGQNGLGALAQSARNAFNPEFSFAAVFTLVFLGCSLYLVVFVLELWVLRYRRR
ncbi:MAG: ATP-binding cassette domain-containing protein [Deinococcales bacterium]